jgi:thiamine biosynthesis lipoprotein
MPREARFPAMGGRAHVIVTGGDDRLVDDARRRIVDLEARWSRFLPDSEISRLNRCPEQAVAVSPETFALLEHAVLAWDATAGRYDPTVLPALRAAGYDRDLPWVIDAALTADPAIVDPVCRTPCHELVAPGCGLIGLDRRDMTVRLPAGVEIDPGGIGKGLAADIVTGELVTAGAVGAMVNVGGDLRVRGEPPEGDSWSIAVEHPLRPDRPDRPLLTLGLGDGGVVSSSRLRRRWVQDGRPRHHIIDPRSGQPAFSDLVAVTVVAADAWWAEVAAKSVFVAGAPASRADVTGVLVATVEADGTVDMSPELAEITA